MKLFRALLPLLLTSLFLASCVSGQRTAGMPSYEGPEPEISIVPRPEKLEREDGAFLLNSATRLYVAPEDPAARQTAEYLAEKLRPATGFDLPIEIVSADSPRPNGILLTIADSEFSAEGYRLHVTPESIVLRGAGEAGLFYGAQTLRQLLPPEIESTTPEPGPWPIAVLRITDQPRFGYRGFMLDCSRHFMSAEFIHEFLEQMAYYKLNKFHWHLVDNGGWRLEVDRYPKLTEIAAWRGEGEHRYGGYYSKEDVREILAHARRLHIQVIPEIEMPAHLNAALWAYPELTCSGERWERGTEGRTVYTQGVGMIPLCPGRDATLDFFRNVLDETAALFPSPVIHLGGDERPKGFWTECPRCQARIKEEGLAGEDELQTWFMRRMTDHLATKNRRAMSWAVTTTDPYDPQDMADIGNDAIIQNWHGGTHFAAAQGMDVVNARNDYVYFDYPQFEGVEKPDWMPVNSLEHVYEFDPVTPRTKPEHANHVLGAEACLWTESVPEARVEQMVYPRLLSFTEAAWSLPERKDLDDLHRRVENHKNRFEVMGIDYGKPPEE